MENLDQYFKMYDEAMNIFNDMEADEAYYNKLESEAYKAMQEEYMWYKYEDYMLWKKHNS